MTGELAQGAVGDPLLNAGIFVFFVLVTLVIVFRASRRAKTAADYYAAGRSFTGPQNGVAISGDYLSAASFLGIAGAIAVYGYDGFLYSIGFLVAWLVALLLVAELLRNTGKFTMGDVLSFRMRRRPVRAAAAVSTLVVSFFYLLAQMAGAGGLVALLLNVEGRGAQALVVAVVGLLMIVYVLVGGMRGTTWVQIVKATLLIIGAGMMTAWALGSFGLNLSALLGEAAARSSHGQAVLAPGLQYGKNTTTKIDFVSLGLALVLGTAGLPHILMRFYTVPSAREARRTVVWAIWLIGIFYLFSLVIGYAAAALVAGGPQRIAGMPGEENSAAPLLAYQLGGEVLLGFISAVAFATILAVVAGLTITASASFAHDVYANVVKRGNLDPDREVLVARITACVIGALAVGGGIVALGQNVAFLVALAFAVAASANLPTILYSLFWRRFNTSGVLWSMYGGLTSCVLLIVFSPAVSGTPKSMFPSLDFAIFPLRNPALVSVPLAFLLGYLGTVLGKGEAAEEARFAEMEVRALTGAGAERSQAAEAALPSRPRPPLDTTPSGSTPIIPAWSAPAPLHRGRRRRIVLATGVMAGVVILVVAVSMTRVLASAPPGADTTLQLGPNTVADVGPEVAIPALGATIPVGGTPGFVAVSPNGRHAYIANGNARVVTVVDTAVNQVTATIPIAAGPPQFLAFAPDGRTLYVTVFNDQRTVHAIDVLDTESNTVIATIPQPARPYLPAVSRDGKRLFVPNHDTASLSVIDTDTNSVITEVKVAPNPHWVAFSRDGRRAYTANHESNLVSVIDTTTLEVLATIPVGTSPHSIAVHPNLPLVANVNYGADTMSVINTVTDRVVATVPVGRHPQDITWAPDGRFAYVVNEGSNTVTVIDARTNRVTATIPTGAGPTSIAVLPNGRQAYVSDLSSGTLTVLELTG
ncbi:MAG: cation/acetate symporter ActP [Pseudonocardiales bacterium]|nr:cation/acetate symporter ActP [Pseudonocardiales bacterium]